MGEIITGIYFIGVVMFGIAVGSYTHIPQYAFMIIGIGTIIYSAIAAIVYFNPEIEEEE